ncbi:hypothetical protein M1O17_03325 [Dehalococcoidia bacterium]|nr:hypothetical protein [Dehalococcoidia bacterium]
MKTKHRILSVLTILALVASLSAVMVSPAGAAADPVIKLDGEDVLTGSVGDRVIVRGENFTPDAIITITFGGTVVSTTPEIVKVDADGTFACAFFVPEVTGTTDGKAYEVKAAGVVSDTATFNVRSTIKLSPSSGPKGTAVTVTGTGFGSPAGLSVDVRVDGALKATTEVDGKGSFITTVTPDKTATIKAVDGAANKATASFTLTPTITLDPTSGLVGIEVTVKGEGFPPRAAGNVRLLFAGAVRGTDPANPEVDEAGKFTFTFMVPGDATAGGKLVRAWADADGGADYDVGEPTAIATYTVGARSMTLSPTEGPVGTTVTATGVGLAPAKTVDVCFAGEVMVSTKTDKDGAFAATFGVPVKPAGTYDVVATAADTRVKASFKIPAAKIEVSPTSGIAGSTVTVQGTGFPKFSKVFIYIGAGGDDYATADAEVTPVPSVLTNDIGNFSADFVVPGIGIGSKKVTVDAGGVTKIQDDFKITAAVVTVADALRGIKDDVVEVWHFDNVKKAWSQFLAAEPEAVPEDIRLESLAAYQPYWIYVTADTTLIYRGHVYALTAGWNNIVWRG